MRTYLVAGLMVSACSLTSSFDDFEVVEDGGVDGNVPDGDLPEVGPELGMEGGAPETGPDMVVDDMSLTCEAPLVPCVDTCVSLGTTEHCLACNDACGASEVCGASGCIAQGFSAPYPGAPGRNFAFFNDIAVSESGEVYATGFVTSDGRASPGSSSQAILAEFSGRTGAMNWFVLSSASNARDAGRDVEVRGDDIYVAGVTTGALRVGGTAIGGTANDRVVAYVLRLSAATNGGLIASATYDVGPDDGFSPLVGPRLALADSAVVMAFSSLEVTGDGVAVEEQDGGSLLPVDLFTIGLSPDTLDLAWFHQLEDNISGSSGFDTGEVDLGALTAHGDRVFLAAEHERAVEFRGARIESGPSVFELSAAVGPREREVGHYPVVRLSSLTAIQVQGDSLFVGGSPGNGTAIWQRRLEEDEEGEVFDVTSTNSSVLRGLTVDEGSIRALVQIRNDTSFAIGDMEVLHMVQGSTLDSDVLVVRMTRDGAITGFDPVAEGAFDDRAGAMVRASDDADIVGVNVETDDMWNASIVRSLP